MFLLLLPQTSLDLRCCFNRFILERAPIGCERASERGLLRKTCLEKKYFLSFSLSTEDKKEKEEDHAKQRNWEWTAFIRCKHARVCMRERERERARERENPFAKHPSPISLLFYACMGKREEWETELLPSLYKLSLWIPRFFLLTKTRNSKSVHVKKLFATKLNMFGRIHSFQRNGSETLIL